jgi:2,3-bisphosphoglycerate-independent phosphoglycerate mutase
MKNIFVILDGAAGLPNEIGKKSALDAAKTPNLDYFAKEGKCGLVRTVGKGIAPESDVAVVALLGYDPYKYFTGRGPLEAYGAEIKLGKNFVAFRTNFATIYGNSIADRRVGRELTTREAKILEKTINKKVKLPCKFVYKSTIGHRGVLVLYGKLKSDISNVDPAYKIEGKFGVAKNKNKMEIQKVKALKKGSEKTADIVNSFVEQSIDVLSNHKLNQTRKLKGLLPANALLLRDAGEKLPKFPQKKKWGAIVAMPLEIGIAKLAGMDILKFKYPECRTNNVYKFLFKGLKETIKYSNLYIKKYWNKYDNFYVHFKECDIPGHDGLPEEKAKMIELIDKKFFSKLRKMKDFRLIVTSDHATPCKLKSHSDDPVALLFYGNGKDKMTEFSEKSCQKGSLKTRLGKDIMKLVTK